MPSPTSPYPQAAAFHFSVTFGTNAADADASFQEVSGIGPEFETEPLPEGGENRYTLQVPKAVRAPKLTLKRRVAGVEAGDVVQGGAGRGLGQADLSQDAQRLPARRRRHALALLVDPER